MGRNRIKPGDKVELSLTPGLLTELERLTDTHLYGKNVPETIVQILSQEVRRLIASAELDKMAARQPVRVASDDDSDNEG